MSGVLGGAAIAAYGARKERKVEQKVSIDSDRFILNKIRSTPKSAFRAFFLNYRRDFCFATRQIEPADAPFA
ncbi:hypothetical protein [Mastigocladopsis repens]|uniref:hypothetical protein n=1 Tax=Mastigocladopsis repens TaxID=221287 RepID=UPI0003178CB2|nr:hypothetical protein [Mastigocladopsis repens]